MLFLSRLDEHQGPEETTRNQNPFVNVGTKIKVWLIKGHMPKAYRKSVKRSIGCFLFTI